MSSSMASVSALQFLEFSCLYSSWRVIGFPVALTSFCFITTDNNIKEEKVED